MLYMKLVQIPIVLSYILTFMYLESVTRGENAGLYSTFMFNFVKNYISVFYATFEKSNARQFLFPYIISLDAFLK